ncbi:MAG: metalloregulator ArsR/SmtB family transcription factor [Pseudomonadota bacterium]
MDPFSRGVETLKAVAEPTRLRLLALLEVGDLSVKDLTTVLGQSQPRLSRHLKLLTDAGWITRSPEGSWVYYRLTDRSDVRGLWSSIVELMVPHTDVLSRDLARLNALKAEQQDHATAFFAEQAARWDSLRSVLVPEDRVEKAILSVLGTERVERFLDIGTGTGRMLALLSDLYAGGLGIDTTPAMLQAARANLQRLGLAHAQVRQGDALTLELAKDSQDLIALHQVMHFFDDPRPVLEEVQRVLAPSGRLLIVDFASHSEERLRTEHRHRRLGFDADEVNRWLTALGLCVRETVRLDLAEENGLAINLWLAQDTRVQVDAPRIQTDALFA